MKKLIVMMGGQGVGKGTFSRMLMRDHEYTYIEVGALLRALPEDSPIKQIMARGELVPDTELFSVLEAQITPIKDVILDGFPRKPSQAQWLIDKFANKFDIHIIYLNVPESVMIARINKRINEGGGRSDDADSTIVRRRLDNFWHSTVPAIEWLKSVNKIKFSDIHVDDTDVNNNFAKVKTAVNS